MVESFWEKGPTRSPLDKAARKAADEAEVREVAYQIHQRRELTVAAGTLFDGEEALFRGTTAFDTKDEAGNFLQGPDVAERDWTIASTIVHSPYKDRLRAAVTQDIVDLKGKLGLE